MDEKKSKLKILKKAKLIMVGIVVLAIVAVLIYIRFFMYNDTPTLSADYVTAKLTEASELTTAKLVYTGVADYSDDGIPVLTKADFTMVYEATVRAGIDVEKIQTEVDDENRIVWLSVPSAEVLDVKVHSDTIRYFNESITLFNPNEKEDSDKAQALAEQDAQAHAGEMGILELANQQAETLVKGILEGCVLDYEIKFKKQ